MTFEVMLSQLADPAEFDKAVKTHIERLRAFRFEKGKPRPTDHPLVEKAIKRVPQRRGPDEYIADYRIVDDGANTPDKMSLNERKAICEQRLHEKANAAKHAVMPQRKIHLFNIHLTKAMNVKEEERTDEDTALIKQADDIRAKYQEVDHIVAHALHDIEDLTPETVRSWQPPEFP
jgi:hypothetical protein